MKRFRLFIIIFLIVGVISYLFYTEGTLPVDKNDTTSKIINIPKGSGLNYIANYLRNQGLIRNRVVFFIVVKQLGVEKNIQAGNYRLSPSMDTFEIAKNLTHGTFDTWVTVIEGMRKEEVAHLLSEKLDIPEEEIIDNSQEGTLFPDTYLFPKDATVGAVLQIISTNFTKKYSQELQNEARKKLLTDHEVLTLASIVEKEAKYEEDKQKAASVLLKRYRNGMPLQSDSTIVYALGYQEEGKTWWKKALTTADLNLNSPYNSYKHTGLPPTPICNPGVISIKAVLEADENTPYLFFVSDSKGHLHYATTNEEHEQNIKKYLR